MYLRVLCGYGFSLLARCAQYRSIHVLDHVAGKLAGLHLGRAFHHPLEVIGDFLLQDGLLHAILDQVEPPRAIP